MEGVEMDNKEFHKKNLINHVCLWEQRQESLLILLAQSSFRVKLESTEDLSSQFPFYNCDRCCYCIV